MTLPVAISSLFGTDPITNAILTMDPLLYDPMYVTGIQDPWCDQFQHTLYWDRDEESGGSSGGGGSYNFQATYDYSGSDDDYLDSYSDIYEGSSATTYDEHGWFYNSGVSTLSTGGGSGGGSSTSTATYDDPDGQYNSGEWHYNYGTTPYVPDTSGMAGSLSTFFLVAEAASINPNAITSGIDSGLGVGYNIYRTMIDIDGGSWTLSSGAPIPRSIYSLSRKVNNIDVAFDYSMERNSDGNFFGAPENGDPFTFFLIYNNSLNANHGYGERVVLDWLSDEVRFRIQTSLFQTTVGGGPFTASVKTFPWYGGPDLFRVTGQRPISDGNSHTIAVRVSNDIPGTGLMGNFVSHLSVEKAGKIAQAFSTMFDVESFIPTTTSSHREVQLWIDGTYQGCAYAPYLGNFKPHFAIGQNGPLHGFGLTGDVGHIAYFDKALTDSQIRLLHASATIGPSGGKMALDEGIDNGLVVRDPQWIPAMYNLKWSKYRPTSYQISTDNLYGATVSMFDVSRGSEIVNSIRTHFAVAASLNTYKQSPIRWLRGTSWYPIGQPDVSSVRGVLITSFDIEKQAPTISSGPDEQLEDHFYVGSDKVSGYLSTFVYVDKTVNVSGYLTSGVGIYKSGQIYQTYIQNANGHNRYNGDDSEWPSAYLQQGFYNTYRGNVKSILYFNATKIRSRIRPDNATVIMDGCWLGIKPVSLGGTTTILDVGTVKKGTIIVGIHKDGDGTAGGGITSNWKNIVGKQTNLDSASWIGTKTMKEVRINGADGMFQIGQADGILIGPGVSSADVYNNQFYSNADDTHKPYLKFKYWYNWEQSPYATNDFIIDEGDN